jgi:hypothetical protein
MINLKKLKEIHKYITGKLLKTEKSKENRERDSLSKGEKAELTGREFVIKSPEGKEGPPWSNAARKEQPIQNSITSKNTIQD